MYNRCLFINIVKNMKRLHLLRYQISHSVIMLKFSFHCSGAGTRASDNSDMNPFMIAVEKGHLEVAKTMIRNDPALMSMPLGSGSTVIHWALEKGHSRSAFFKVCFFLSIIT